MSAAHDVPARSAPDEVRALIGAETVVEVVAPRWRWRIITPDQWRLLSRLGPRARVRDLVGSADGAAAAEVLDRVVELVRAGLCVLEEADRVGEDGPGPRPEPVDPPRDVDAAWPWPPAPTPAHAEAPEPEPPAAEPPAVEPPVVEPSALPRRDPGRTLSPVAAVLQRRHVQIRSQLGGPRDDVFRAPDTGTLRRLLGGLHSLEDPASPGPGGDR